MALQNTQIELREIKDSLNTLIIHLDNDNPEIAHLLSESFMKIIEARTKLAIIIKKENNLNQSETKIVK